MLAKGKSLDRIGNLYDLNRKKFICLKEPDDWYRKRMLLFLRGESKKMNTLHSNLAPLFAGFVIGVLAALSLVMMMGAK